MLFLLNYLTPMDKTLVTLFSFLVVALGISVAMIAMPLKECYDGCTSAQQVCLIEQHNVTGYYPMPGDKISNITNSSVYWTIHSHSKPSNKYAINVWNGTRPIPGNYSCYFNNKEYLPLGHCYNRCHLPFLMFFTVFILAR